MTDTPRHQAVARRGPRARRRLSHVLVGLVLLALLPAVLLSAFVVVRQWRAQQQEVERNLTETVRALAESVDQEVISSVKRLELLAGSPTLAGELERFERYARRVVGLGEDWTSLVLVHPSGQQVMNLAAAPGEALPSSLDQAYIREVLSTRRPVVSDVVIGQVTGRPSVRVAVPVLRDGTLEYVLAAELNLDRFQAYLSEGVVREGGIGSIHDSNLLYIARSRDSEAYVGAHADEFMRELLLREPAAGLHRSPVNDGADVYRAWWRSPLTGWTVTLGVPVPPLHATLWRPLLELGGVGLLLSLLGGVVALARARRIGASIDSAKEGALALAARRPVPDIDPLLQEVDELGAALQQTSELLNEQDAERVRLLASESEARALAERESRNKDRFLAMLGHELRNPLAAVRMATALLERHDGEDLDQRRRTEALIARQTAHLTRLVDDLLDVARVAMGKVSITRAPVALDAVVVEAVQGIAGEGTDDTVSVSTEPVWVDGDITRLSQVVTNLVGNALKFTPEGRRVSVTVKRQGGEAVLEVKDAGAGIPKELLPHVFDLFVQGDQDIDRKGGGLGIGLALVRHLVEMHGGHIEAKSDGEGRGSTFVVRLPRREPPSLEGEAGQKAAAPATARRIVVIEDNDDARTSLVSLLESWGHAVEAAADGRIGLDLVQRTHPDVALIDIGLPQIDGYAIARAVRATADGDAPWLVALTGYGTREDRDRALAAGFDLHVTKPVDPTRLAHIVDHPA